MNKSQHSFAVLLAGGQGSRFWPQSRTLEPKQFLCLHKDKTLFEQTIKRVLPLVPPCNIFIATSELYRSQVLELCAPFSIPESNLFLEPEGKNTAPSICATVKLISLRDPLARVAVLPCDHLIKNPAKFSSLVAAAFSVADDSLVVFGIPPLRPATGYGYIRVARCAGPGKGGALVPAEKFCEKPDLKTAIRFLRSGRYFWNSGMFVGSARVFLDEFKSHMPSLYRVLGSCADRDGMYAAWKRLTPESFDYGVLEKTTHVKMIVAGGLGWSDLGSWQAWDEMLAKDKDGNAFKGDVISVGSSNTTVWGAHRLIAAVGLDDCIVVDTPDALLITKKSKSEAVKKIVDALKAQHRQEHYLHRTVKRPWGAYTVLDTGIGFKVKLVEVQPGKSLSLQKHLRRSEHWVVVEGTAKIVRGRRSYYVKENESTFIPIGCEHRIINTTGELLKIVEVQSGNYLEEDDIVRLKDDFGREVECKK